MPRSPARHAISCRRCCRRAGGVPGGHRHGRRHTVLLPRVPAYGRLYAMSPKRRPPANVRCLDAADFDRGFCRRPLHALARQGGGLEPADGWRWRALERVLRGLRRRAFRSDAGLEGLGSRCGCCAPARPRQRRARARLPGGGQSHRGDALRSPRRHPRRVHARAALPRCGRRARSRAPHQLSGATVRTRPAGRSVYRIGGSTSGVAAGPIECVYGLQALTHAAMDGAASSSWKAVAAGPHGGQLRKRTCA